MVRLFDSINAIKNECSNIGVMFSGGRDSIVMLDIFQKITKSRVSKYIFMYYCPGLQYQETILKYYENRYKIKIERIPHFDANYMINSRGKKKKLKMADAESYIKDKYGVTYLAFGYRKSESLHRRGMLSSLTHGVDHKYKKVYPIADWTEPHISKYVNRQKLKLPVEYKYGFRDLNAFKGDTIKYIYNNYPEDYQRIINIYPDVEAEILR